MEKLIIKNVSVILTFVLFVSTIFGISAHAISTSCVEDHFSNLITTGSDSNQVVRTPPSENSCPYTAISMLLSFYDSYWRDDFIVSADGINETDWEQGIYDPETDTLIETFNASEESGDWTNFQNIDETNYSEFITHPDNDHYLESYLISLAKEIDLCNDDDTVFGLKDYEIFELLEYYLYDIRGFTEDQITVHLERAVDIGSDDDSLFDQMVNHINEGFPLIYTGYDWDVDLSEVDLMNQIQQQTGGHALIAYSFDGTIDNPTDVNLHTGWSTSEIFQSVNETEYRFLNSIIWLEIIEENLPHQCTNAYSNPENTQTFCACEIYCGTHRNGKHTAISGYDYADVSGHHKSCARCGEENVSVESHNAYYNHIPCNNNNYHRGVCSLCGYETTYPHIVEQVSGKIGRCILCGASVIMGNQTIMPWGDVGGTVDTSAANDGKQYITENGSCVLPNGVIIISNIDYSLYLSGELDIYELIDGGCCTEYF